MEMMVKLLSCRDIDIDASTYELMVCALRELWISIDAKMLFILCIER